MHELIFNLLKMINNSVILESISQKHSLAVRYNEIRDHIIASVVQFGFLLCWLVVVRRRVKALRRTTTYRGELRSCFNG